MLSLNIIPSSSDICQDPSNLIQTHKSLITCNVKLSSKSSLKSIYLFLPLCNLFISPFLFIFFSVMFYMYLYVYASLPLCSTLWRLCCWKVERCYIHKVTDSLRWGSHCPTRPGLRRMNSTNRIDCQTVAPWMFSWCLTCLFTEKLMGIDADWFTW